MVNLINTVNSFLRLRGIHKEDHETDAKGIQ